MSVLKSRAGKHKLPTMGNLTGMKLMRVKFITPACCSVLNYNDIEVKYWNCFRWNQFAHRLEFLHQWKRGLLLDRNLLVRTVQCHRSFHHYQRKRGLFLQNSSETDECYWKLLKTNPNGVIHEGLRRSRNVSGSLAKSFNSTHSDFYSSFPKIERFWKNFFLIHNWLCSKLTYVAYGRPSRSYLQMKGIPQLIFE